ncbi:hypothetical protein DFJ73DRAFT_779739 [Zopfochytrium polystomum]|nr:hypothetical protein DFJ73DRAFT_779739 [Zopfochytrium polystomum]
MSGTKYGGQCYCSDPQELSDTTTLTSDPRPDAPALQNAVRAFFADHNARFAGLEYGGQCYCAVALPSEVPFPESTCDMPCRLQPGETCGGTWALPAY